MSVLLLLLVVQIVYAQKKQAPVVVNILFTSDAHYGLKRAAFRGDTSVTAHKVNAAMIEAMNTVPELTLPADTGVNANGKVGHVDYVIQTGDITNRMELPIQSAAASWAEFKNDYLNCLKLKNSKGVAATLLLAPGNHDISNAIGYYKPMNPHTDATSMVNIYNLMLHPRKLLTVQSFNYTKDKVNYSRDIQGVHCMFITLWPDSAERIWMEKNLSTVPSTTPVLVFSHDQPTCEAVHFTNPTPPYKIISGNKFENLVAEHYKESNSVMEKGTGTDVEQRGWVKFLEAHPNIKAYFHGNSNWNEFYVYQGPDKDVNLNVFRVDSPMKGKYSGIDESKLSFQLISLDASTKTLTVRECLWNTDIKESRPRVIFGKSKTISLK